MNITCYLVRICNNNDNNNNNIIIINNSLHLMGVTGKINWSGIHTQKKL